MKRRTQLKPKPTLPSPRTTTFVLHDCEATKVFIAGSFTGWALVPMDRLGQEGRWEKRLVLGACRHEYRYVVDGEWIDDPEAVEFVPNPHGSRNCIIAVLGSI